MCKWTYCEVKINYNQKRLKHNKNEKNHSFDVMALIMRYITLLKSAQVLVPHYQSSL